MVFIREMEIRKVCAKPIIKSERLSEEFMLPFLRGVGPIAEFMSRESSPSRPRLIIVCQHCSSRSLHLALSLLFPHSILWRIFNQQEI